MKKHERVFRFALNVSSTLLVYMFCSFAMAVPEIISSVPIVRPSNPPVLKTGVVASSGIPSKGSVSQDTKETTARVLLVPDRETILAANMSGRLLELAPRPGEHVNKGGVLVRFDCQEAIARRDMAQSELESARLFHEGRIRMQGLQSAAELEVEMAAAAVTKARSQVRVAKAQVNQCGIAAPFSGRVVKWHAKPFQSVNVGAPLIELVSDAPPRIKVNVPSRWIVWLKTGVGFEISIEETGKRYHARVQHMNGRIDSVSQTIEIEGVLVGNPSDVLPGMSGTATFNRVS